LPSLRRTFSADPAAATRVCAQCDPPGRRRLERFLYTFWRPLSGSDPEDTGVRPLGELLFDTQDVPANQEGKDWDGTFRGGSVGTGVYVWVAELQFVDGVVQLYECDVTVVR